jgi:hypothetical protein
MIENINKELIIQYYKLLVGNCFKILPIYEGKDVYSKEVVYLPESAFSNYQKYVANLIVELCGSDIFFTSVNSVRIVSILRGVLKEVNVNEHQKLKPLVMECIKLCNKIIDELNKEGD